MLFIKAIILAIVQGVTEFIPVSSSGHLVLLHDYLILEKINEMSFDIALHFGTAIALIIYFRREISIYLKTFFLMFRKFDVNDNNQRVVVNLIIATIPAVLIGYFLESQIETFFRNSMIVAIALIIGGFLFFIVEKFSKQIYTIKQMSWPMAIFVGLAQALALIPGVSRSGITIIAGMTAKLNRFQAAKFSFLLSIPIVLGAGLKNFLSLDYSQMNKTDLLLFLVGILVSLSVGYLVIKFFLKFLETRKLTIFGVYRIVLGIIILLFII